MVPRSHILPQTAWRSLQLRVGIRGLLPCDGPVLPVMPLSLLLSDFLLPRLPTPDFCQAPSVRNAVDVNDTDFHSSSMRYRVGAVGPITVANDFTQLSSPWLLQPLSASEVTSVKWLCLLPIM